MTLDEAIAYAEDVAQRNEEKINDDLTHAWYPVYFMDTLERSERERCACQHRQLAEWLKDYRKLVNFTEKVNHPEHYNIPGKRECIEQIVMDYGPYITIIFCLTSAYKYLYRAGEKPGESYVEDVQKARWYYDYCIELDRDYPCMGHGFALRNDVEKLLLEKEDGNTKN